MKEEKVARAMVIFMILVAIGGFVVGHWVFPYKILYTEEEEKCKEVGGVLKKEILLFGQHDYTCIKEAEVIYTIN